MSARRRSLAVAISAILATGALALSAGTASAAPYLAGQWTFEDPAAPETTGFWTKFARSGGKAVISNGELHLKMGGWARASGPTYQAGGYGPKTMIAWVRLDDLQTGGSPMSIWSACNIGCGGGHVGDVFDAIVYGERQPNQWMAGSENYNRTQDFVPGFADTAVGVGTTRQIAIAYAYDDYSRRSPTARIPRSTTAPTTPESRWSARPGTT